MKLFQMKNWELTVSEEAYGIVPFKKILERDKSKEKEKAMKEMLFVYFYSDVKSDYQYITNKKDKSEEIKKDIGLPKSWKIDKVIEDAIDVYTKRSQTIIEKLYVQSMKSASEIGNYLENTKALLEERDKMGKPVTDINKISQSVQRVPKLMRDLKEAYKEVIKEKEDNENKQKGSRKFNIFEDGL